MDKNYAIWTKSHCISGRTEEQRLEELVQAVRKGVAHWFGLIDNEGVLQIRLSDIEAIAINDIVECNDIGFKEPFGTINCDHIVKLDTIT